MKNIYKRCFTKLELLLKIVKTVSNIWCSCGESVTITMFNTINLRHLNVMKTMLNSHFQPLGGSIILIRET